MLAEREILVSILQATSKDRCVRIEDVSRGLRFPKDLINRILEGFRNKGLMELGGGILLITSELRMKMAVRAIELGADVERVSRFLNWDEFEELSTLAFKKNGFQVKKNFRFSWMKRRWEVDVLGIRKPVVISADCKHWQRGWSGAASIRAAEKQVERTEALAEASVSKIIRSRIGIDDWKHAYFIPIILSLAPSRHKFYEKTPIVPIMQLKDFLQNIIVYIDEVNAFHVIFQGKENN